MIPDEKTLLDNLGKIAYTLDKAYIAKLSQDYHAVAFDENRKNEIQFENNIREIRIDRWVFDKKEKPGDCLKNVLSLFADGDHTIATVITRNPISTEMYFVVKNTGMSRNEDSKNNVELLNEAIKGNFSGTHTTVIDDFEVATKLFSFENSNSVAVLSNTPSEYSEDYISQGLDKLLNGIIPKSEEEAYSVVFLAESLKNEEIREIISGFEDIATAMYPFMGYQYQSGKNESSTQGEMKSIANTESISDSVFKTHSINVGMNVGISGDLGIIGANGGISGGYGYSWGKSKTVSNGATETTGTSSSISIGKSDSTNYSYKSYMVSNLIEKTESTIKRLYQSQATGLWKFATYVFAKDSKTSKNVANYLRAVTQGKDSYIEPSVIQEWAKTEGNEDSDFNEIREFVSHFTHPVFYTADKDNNNRMMVTPTAYVGTEEVSNVIGFPRKSVVGLPIIECAQFGREPHSLLALNSNLNIGCAYHMHESYDGTIVPKQIVGISKAELTKHTFITGSTGSGKSNTIYTILDRLKQEKVSFLVIEPAKGEYRTAFSENGINVFGTNPNIEEMQLLRINPFSFPENTHVLEHLDRLIEVFNVCWPMYAAMPAILKDAMERAYVSAGWNLMTSQNRYSDSLYPSFADVLAEIKNVLNESDYSADNKGDYSGSLVTRIKSLTNGINGLIFTTNDVEDSVLFDQNTIIDLSRIGSTETKALIMGMLVLKLQEYRMSQRIVSKGSDEDLKHITVLEEAHNLLKRTSTEQSNEASNLLGKSVEMLSNAIAEMRTYGEGFIIADQAPGLLDMSVIRNTNTKIIMRLPDFSDRELVGRASGMTDDQIVELGKLEMGVAAVSQSDWLEPVLCKIDKYEKNKQQCETIYSNNLLREIPDNPSSSLLDYIMTKEIYRKVDRVDIEKYKDLIIRSDMETRIKCEYLSYIETYNDKDFSRLRSVVYEFLHAKQAVELSKGCSNLEEWARQVADKCNPSITSYTKEQINLALALIVCEQAKRDSSYNELYRGFTEKYRKNGGVV